MGSKARKQPREGGRMEGARGCYKLLTVLTSTQATLPPRLSSGLVLALTALEKCIIIIYYLCY